ncbi:MAG: ABC transporter permease [Thermofilum sp.]|jgi:ABC-2 type transport system permease protein|uniref:ABC transporter permease n=1 Tax=Thermofilum sp. TaxID=1961369 RepID=UPI0025894ABE|nr:ABC transporter permease [Thermofilum sp.]MCI4409332.1 ABC transporter permease [Thermofilum sp.]
MGALTALVIKDVKQLLRDPRSLTMILLMPLAVMAMFVAGYGEEKSTIPIVIVNLDRGTASWQLIEALRTSSTFSIVAYASSIEAGKSLVQKGVAYAAVVIPENFTYDVSRGRSTRIITILDAAYATVSELVWQWTVVSTQSFMKKASELYGTFYIEVQEETVYGPKVSAVDSFTSTIMGILLHLVPMSLIAVSISRERERKTFEQLIMAPISSWHVVFGKFLAYALVTVADLAVTLAFAVYLLGVRVKGDLFSLLIVSLLMLLCSLAMGLLISAASRNQLQAYQAAIFVFIPSMLFSGFFRPVELLSPDVQLVSRLLPLYYFFRAFRNIQLRGWSLFDVSWDCLTLGLFTFIFLLAAVRVLRLKVE